MKLKYNPDINANVVKMTISVDSLGTADTTADEESAMLAEFPESIQYKSLTFSRKLNLDSNNDVIEDITNGEVVTVSLINKKILVDANFVAEFEININDIPTSALQIIFNTKEKLARGMAECFRLTIKDAVKAVLTDMRSKKSDFETSSTEII